MPDDTPGRTRPAASSASSEIVGELPLAAARWLVSEDGLAAVATATALLDDAAERAEYPAADPTITAGIRRALGLDGDDQAAHAPGSTTVPGPPAGAAAAVLNVAAARRRARRRWVDADRLLFTRAALEQASDPAVSAWRARRYLDAHTWDLCAGAGADTLALVTAAASVVAVDLDPSRLELLSHNLRIRGRNAKILHDDVLRVRPPRDALLHADPGRRTGDRRLRSLRELQPPVDALLAAHADAAGIGIVVGPGVADDDPVLGDNIEVEHVQVGEQLVEAVLWRGVLRGADHAVASATLLPAEPIAPGSPPTGALTRTRRAGDERPLLPLGEVGNVLIEVAPAAVRARLHDTIGDELGAWRLARRRALLSSDRTPPDSPWYRARTVLTVLPARPKAVRAWLRTADPDAVELVLHGADADVAGWWRALGRPPRGPQGLRVELVRRDVDTIVVVTDARRLPAVGS